MIWVSVQKLQLGCSWERSERHPPEDSFNGFSALLVINWFPDFISMLPRWRGQWCFGLCCQEEGKQDSVVPQFNQAAYRSGAMKGWRSASLILATLWPCWCYKRMLKLKVGASFQVLTIEQKAQPTLVHLLKLVKIKIHSRLSSCHSQYNYCIGEGCLNWSCCSTHLF